MALMFEPIYGSIFWHIHIHNKDEGNPPSFSTSDFHYHLPIALQDLNSDGFAELLFPVVELPSTPLREGKKSHLILVSGRSGAVIGQPFSIANCYNILEVFKEDVSIGYTCSMENRSELTGKIPITTLLNEMEKDFGGEHFRNDSLDLENSHNSPEVNDAICQIRYSNEGRCPYCKTRIEFGLSAENPINQEYEYSRVVSWRIFTDNNACKGAVLKLWKWDVNSLQKAFQEGVSPKLKSKQESQESVKGDFDFKLNPSKNEGYPSLYNDNEGLDPTFPVDKYAYDDDYNEKEGASPPLGDPIIDSFARKATEQAPSFLARNRLNRNINSQLTDPKTKRSSDHIDPLKQETKQKSSNHGNLEGQESLTEDSFRNHSTGYILMNMTSLPFSTLIAPSGYRLQKLEEVLVLLSFNGSDWVTKELGSMVVYQLCQKDCIPSHVSQKDSVLIDVNSLRFDIWNIYVSSSSFSSLKEDENGMTQVTWSLESYIRRLLKPV